ncbi:Pro-kumamolisin, activation domain-containing protein [Ochromonadaceae sp. CCMP2298]|nr:Pro-kumamolisin, activation domain-containing protein [Ochromonadaceae sp. CCMP2298]|mmetsp:Transcript_23872/g.53027  ORF Transcript_23872/g.53027 Transcript_23872/m.53027 type:complete len:370 (-) Transcript_23872:103-1212(-)
MRLIATLALCLALASSCDAAYTPDLTPSLSPGLAPEAPDTPGRLMEQSNFHTRTDVLQHGRAPATAMHEVVFARKQNNMDLLELLLERVSDPLSEQYGQHLTRAEVTAMTSNPTAVTQIRLFLTKHDIQLLKVSPHEDYFTTLAPVALWEECLNATFYEFSHPAYDSRVLRAHSYYLPAGLAPHVVLFNTVQLPDYYDLGQSPKPMTPTHNPHASEHSDPHPYSRSVQGAQAVNGDATTPDMDITSLIMETPTTPSPKRSYGFSTQAKGYVEPSLLNKVYNIPSNTGTKATSQAIYAILEQSFSPSDLKTFQDYFSLPREAIDSSVGGYVSNSACADDVNNCIEANLDGNTYTYTHTYVILILIQLHLY